MEDIIFSIFAVGVFVLKIRAVFFSEKSIAICKTTRRHNLEGRSPNIRSVKTSNYNRELIDPPRHGDFKECEFRLFLSNS